MIAVTCHCGQEVWFHTQADASGRWTLATVTDWACPARRCRRSLRGAVEAEISRLRAREQRSAA